MNEPIVTVKEGKLRGVVLQSVLETSYIAFRGIPYAIPPIGELRFKDPKPITPWTGVRDATKSGACAPQKDEYPPNNYIGDEDCLYLNVYTKSLNQSKPVMFWVHGGAFLVGTGSDMLTRPDYLLTKDVVIVSPNYRLGVLGFLNLGHKIATGNQGFKDLILALKWVKENISSFGGDPNNITVFGASAGAALSHFLCLSPASKGLIQRVILQSGSAICPWAIEANNTDNAYKLACLLGNDSKDPIEVFEFLCKVPCRELIEMQSDTNTQTRKGFMKISFGLNIDDIAENPVLPLPLEQLRLNDSNISMMIGYATHEFIMLLKDTSEAGLKWMNERLPYHAQKLLKKNTSTDVEQFANKVREWYFNGKPVSKDNIASLIKFLGDVYFILPAMRLVKDRTKRNCPPTYLYKFSYVGNEKTITNVLMSNPPICGASHVDELSYIFYQPRCKIESPEPPAPGTKDRITLERMTEMWTNFAKTGNPTPSLDEYINTIWKPVTTDVFNYLEIGNDLKMLTTPPDIPSE